VVADALESKDGDVECVEETQADEFASGVLKSPMPPCVGADTDRAPCIAKDVMPGCVFGCLTHFICMLC
jgi:hypothetical protein